MKPILEAHSIGKKYRIRHLAGGYMSLREKMLDVFKSDRGKEEDFWALKDISFAVQQGDSVGIIGRNGAGKSTLLKVLSRITRPTTGRIVSRGRVASLLEVGTGFHPELTGRENVFFNGSLLGMKRKEIQSKFDEIIDFSGVERFLDTPLKHYSSGMQLRLAFSVAAFLEPEILIIDEVLAVGDVEFQKKCLGKMENVSKSGRTILFVSHNMAAVQSICTKAILMSNGTIKSSGAVMPIIEAYNTSFENSGILLFPDKDLWLTGFSALENKAGLAMKSNAEGKFHVTVESKIDLKDIYIGIGINDVYGVRLFTVFSKFYNQKYDIKKGRNQMVCKLENVPLKPGVYFAEIYVGDGAATAYLYYNYSLKFEILSSENLDHAIIPDASQGHFLINQAWS